MADGMLSWVVLGEHGTEEKCWELRRRALDLAKRLGDREALTYAAFCF